MIRKILGLGLLLLLLVSVPKTTFSKENIYRNSDHNFSFTIPNSWEQIPQDKVDQLSKEITQASNNKVTFSYVAGFYPIVQEKELFPYFLIQAKKIPRLSTQDVLKIANYGSENASELIVEKFNEEYAHQFNQLTVNKPVVDDERHTVTILYGINDQIESLLINIPGGESLVQISIYYPKGERERLILLAESLANSFKYDPGYEYSPLENGTSNNQPSIFEDVLVEGTAYLIIGFFVALFYELVIFLSKKKLIDSNLNIVLPDQSKQKVSKIMKILFSGRIGRKHYLYAWMLLLTLSSIFMYSNIIIIINMLILSIFDAKRLRDIDMPGKIAPIVTVIGILFYSFNVVLFFRIGWQLLLWLREDDKKENKYGKPTNDLPFLEAIQNK